MVAAPAEKWRLEDDARVCAAREKYVRDAIKIIFHSSRHTPRLARAREKGLNLCPMQKFIR